MAAYFYRKRYVPEGLLITTPFRSELRIECFEEQYVSAEVPHLAPNKKKLVVNSFPQHEQMTNAEVTDLLFVPGAVNVELVTNLEGIRSGYAFVYFDDEASARYGMELLDGFPVQEKRVRANFARPHNDLVARAKLYVSQIPTSWKIEHVLDYFAPFGPVEHIVLLRDPETSQSTGTAFVQYISAAQARHAMGWLNGLIPETETLPLIVQLSGKKRAPEVVVGNDVNMAANSGGDAPGTGSINDADVKEKMWTIEVLNLAPHHDESYLRRVFQNFQSLQYIRTAGVYDDVVIPTGQGLITFGNPSDALFATVAPYNGMEIGYKRRMVSRIPSVNNR